MTTALIIPNVGTIVLREDGSVRIVDRNRESYEIRAEVVQAIVRLVVPVAAGEAQA